MAIPLITKVETVNIVTMTKELVDALLEMNTKNRDMRRSLINSFKKEIELGEWELTNQGIGVSNTGILLDGQNRLTALKECGYPRIKMVLMTGMKESAVAAIDRGLNRNARDFMHFMFDKKVSALVAAILRTSFVAQTGFIKENLKPTPHEYAAKLLDIGDSIDAILGIQSTGKLPAAVLAAIVDAHAKGYEDEALSFTHALVSGEMLAKDNPALVLRNWIMANKGSGGATIMIDRYQKTTRAMQAWIEGRSLQKLYGHRNLLKSREQQAAQEF